MITERCDSLMVCRDQVCRLPFMDLRSDSPSRAPVTKGLPALAVTMPVATLLSV